MITSATLRMVPPAHATDDCAYHIRPVGQGGFVKVLQGMLRLGLLAVLAASVAGCGRRRTTGGSSSAPAPTAATAVPTSAVTTTIPACAPSGGAIALTGAGSTFDAPLFAKQFDTSN